MSLFNVYPFPSVSKTDISIVPEYPSNSEAITLKSEIFSLKSLSVPKYILHCQYEELFPACLSHLFYLSPAYTFEESCVTVNNRSNTSSFSTGIFHVTEYIHIQSLSPLEFLLFLTGAFHYHSISVKIHICAHIINVTNHTFFVYCHSYLIH